MTHADEATLVALRDGEPVDPGVRLHVETCVPCRTALADARERARAIDDLLETNALRAGYGPTGAGAVGAGTEHAKAKVRAQLDAQRARESRAGAGLAHLRRAAAILLVAAGAASAFPGSPVRVWLGVDDPAPSPHDAAIAAPTAAPQTPSEAVVLVPAADGIDIELTDVAPDSEVELTWIAGTTAQVACGPGARYAVAEGQARAAAPNGPVRLGIPRSTPRISITINGRLVYSGTSEEATVGDVVRRSAGGLVFTVPLP